MAGETFQPKNIAEVKQYLGPLKVVEIIGSDIQNAHYQLGEYCQNFALQSLNAVLLEANQTYTLGIRLDHMQKVLSRIEKLAENDDQVGQALRQYLTCLEAWAEGASIPATGESDNPIMTEYNSTPNLRKILALLLQDDNHAGCQTVITNSTIAGNLWLVHSEEAEFNHVVPPELVIMNIGQKQKRVFFNYPYLMPGPAFSVDPQGFILAVDAQHTDGEYEENSMLANIACWVLWYLGQQAENPKQIIEQMAPYADGYIVNIARCLENGRTEAMQIEFARDIAVQQRNLPLVAVNMYNQADVITKESPLKINVLVGLLLRLQLIKKSLIDKVSLVKLKELVTSQVLGFEWSWASKITRAFFLGHLAPDKITLYVGAGPAVDHDQLKKLEIDTQTGDIKLSDAVLDAYDASFSID